MLRGPARAGIGERHDRAYGELPTQPEQRERHFEQTRVLEVMTPWPVTIAPEVETWEAARQMLYLDVQRLFVEDRGVLVGVISQTDIVDAVAGARS